MAALEHDEKRRRGRPPLRADERTAVWTIRAPASELQAFDDKCAAAGVKRAAGLRKAMTEAVLPSGEEQEGGNGRP